MAKKVPTCYLPNRQLRNFAISNGVNFNRYLPNRQLRNLTLFY